MKAVKKDENVIVSNPKEFERKKAAIRADGADKLHVLADFDRTLTYAIVNGKRRNSMLAILRDEKYLTPDYPAKAHALFDKYYPIEIDFSVPLSERKKAMQEWWKRHFELLIESKLSKKDIKKVAYSEEIKLRKGFSDFVDYLHERRVPLVIMSANGMGEESISLFLEKEKKLFSNVCIVTNTFEWDENGYLKKINEPIIHSLNKDETAIHEFPVYEKIKDRKNILLLGDSPGDAGMSDGFDAENILKIGFLNEKVEENLKHYQELFDVVLLGDPPFDFVNELVREIL